MNTQKGFVTILAIIIGLLVIGGGAYYLNINTETTTSQQKDSEIQDNDTAVTTESANVDKDTKLEPHVVSQKQQEETPLVGKTPDKTKNLVATTTKTITTSSISTSNNLSDFVGNLKNCKETKFSRSMTADFLGNNAMTDVSYEITNNGGKCLLNITLNKIELSLGDELSKTVGQPNTQFLNSDGSPLDINEFYKDLNETYSSLVGKSGYCDIASNKDELTEFFTKEKGDFISYSDTAFLVFGSDLNCKGPVFDESQKLSLF